LNILILQPLFYIDRIILTLNHFKFVSKSTLKLAFEAHIFFSRKLKAQLFPGHFYITYDKFEKNMNLPFYVIPAKARIFYETVIECRQKNVTYEKTLQGYWD